MSEEIKEILEIFKKINEEYSIDTELDFEDYEIPNIYLKQFLDYITNLQEENKKLKELCNKYEEEHNTKFNEWVFDKRENERLTQGVTLLTNKLIDMTKEKEDYKSRNKKAIEYIKEKAINNCWIDQYEANDLINILKGDNK